MGRFRIDNTCRPVVEVGMPGQEPVLNVRVEDIRIEHFDIKIYVANVRSHFLITFFLLDPNVSEEAVFYRLIHDANKARISFTHTPWGRKKSQDI